MESKTNNVLYILYIFTIIFSVVIVLFYLYILHYINKLESTGCACSENWKREYIKWYFIVLLLMFFIPNILLLLFPKLITILKFINIILFIITAISIFIIYQYIRELKEKKCICSEDDARTTLEIYNYIMIFIFILLLLNAIYSLLFIQK